MRKDKVHYAKACPKCRKFYEVDKSRKTCPKCGAKLQGGVAY